MKLSATILHWQKTCAKVAANFNRLGLTLGPVRGQDWLCERLLWTLISNGQSESPSATDPGVSSEARTYARRRRHSLAHVYVESSPRYGSWAGRNAVWAFHVPTPQVPPPPPSLAGRAVSTSRWVTEDGTGHLHSRHLVL